MSEDKDIQENIAKLRDKIKALRGGNITPEPSKEEKPKSKPKKANKGGTKKASK